MSSGQPLPPDFKPETIDRLIGFGVDAWTDQALDWWSDDEALIRKHRPQYIPLLEYIQAELLARKLRGNA